MALSFLLCSGFLKYPITHAYLLLEAIKLFLQPFLSVALTSYCLGLFPQKFRDIWHSRFCWHCQVNQILLVGDILVVWLILRGVSYFCFGHSRKAEQL